MESCIIEPNDMKVAQDVDVASSYIVAKRKKNVMFITFGFHYYVNDPLSAYR